MIYSRNLYQLIFEPDGNTKPETGFFNNEDVQLPVSEFYNHIQNLTIISGFIGLDPIKFLSKISGNVRKTVVYGMYSQYGISEPLHNKLIEIQEAYPDIDIRYSTLLIHSKIYIWENTNGIERVLSGSAKFSVPGLTTDDRELLSDVDRESYAEVKQYEELVLNHSVTCTDKSIVAKVIEKSISRNKSYTDLKKQGICRMSFLSRGTVPKRSGINWGASYPGRKAHVRAGDAYIPIRKKSIKDFPNLFPPKKYVGIENTQSFGKKNRQNDEIELIWDDGTHMNGLMEANNVDTKTGLIYPKGITSSRTKREIGIYLRNRISKKLGYDIPADMPITKNMLRKYGRDSVDVSLLGEGVYFMDFSVK